MLSFKLSVRNILRTRIYVILNLLGLSIAFSISIFILSFVIREVSFNRSFDNYKRIARPLTIKRQFGWTEPSVSYPLHLRLKDDIPGIEAAAIFRSVRSLNIINGEESIRVRNGYLTTPQILTIFTPEFIYADTVRFGRDPRSILISETLATILFGNIPDPGTVIESTIGGSKESFTIDGVYKDFPVTSAFRPEIMASFDLMKYEFPEGSFFHDFWDHWHMDIFREYVLLEKSADPESVSDRLGNLVADLPENLDYEFTLQPLSKVHLFSSGFANDGGRGDIKFVLLFSAVAVLILVIAISNYIILSIGSSSRRMPEIAIRKIHGAKAAAVRRSVLLESVLICLISLPLAFIISRLSGNAVTQLFNINMELTGPGSFILILLVLLLILFTGIISGSYLAAKLGNTTPLFAVRRSYEKGKGKLLYKTLITIQIIIFVTLLSAALVVLRQINFSKNHDPGFNTDNLIMAYFPSGIVTDFGSFKYELLKSPNIEGVTFGGLLPPTGSSMVTVIRQAEGGEDIRVEGITADFDFINTLGTEIIAGRDFNPDLATDSSATIINQTLARRIGANADNLREIQSPQNVIGIIKDLQVHSVREEIGPMTLQISNPKYISTALIRIYPGTEKTAVEFLGSVFSEYNFSSFSISSYDEIMKGMYGKEARLGYIVMIFGLIALIVALLGVFGLSLFLSNEKRFDTAVFKVFGASARDVVRTNTWRYLAYVGLGNIIAIPLVVIIMNRWLQQFAYKTGISPMIFIITFFLSAIVFLATTFFNTRRLANINPVDNLRQE